MWPTQTIRRTSSRRRKSKRLTGKVPGGGSQFGQTMLNPTLRLRASLVACLASNQDGMASIRYGPDLELNCDRLCRTSHQMDRDENPLMSAIL
jgi:hypothetical protein